MKWADGYRAAVRDMVSIARRSANEIERRSQKPTRDEFATNALRALAAAFEEELLATLPYDNESADPAADPKTKH